MIVPARPGHTNMFLEPAHIMVNTVNCMGISGAGVAKEMKLRWPDMHDVYKWACDHGQLAPGQLHIWTDLDSIKRTGHFFQIINFPTKTHWRKDSKLEHIQLGLMALKAYLARIWEQPLVTDAQEHLGTVFDYVQNPMFVSIPALGCGNGNLDWAVVRPMIVEALEDVSLGMVITLFPPKGEAHDRIKYEDLHLCHRPAGLD